jgi:hypothetical protein
MDVTSVSDANDHDPETLVHDDIDDPMIAHSQSHRARRLTDQCPGSRWARFRAQLSDGSRDPSGDLTVEPAKLTKGRCAPLDLVDHVSGDVELGQYLAMTHCRLGRGQRLPCSGEVGLVLRRLQQTEIIDRDHSGDRLAVLGEHRSLTAVFRPGHEFT